MVYPQILACTPKMGTQRVHVPSAENWSGHAGAGSEQPLESISFLNHKDSIHLPIYCKFCPSNDIVTIFPMQMRGQPKLTLP